MLAEIASGKTGLADVLFLVGFILFVLAFLTELPATRPNYAVWWRLLCAAGLACVALAWLVL